MGNLFSQSTKQNTDSRSIDRKLVDEEMGLVINSNLLNSLKKDHGEVKLIDMASNTIFATCYEENCWIAGGNQNRAKWRIQFEDGVVIWIKDDNILAIF